MSELKTKPTDKDVNEYLNKIENVKKREDCYKLLAIMNDITKEKPVIWGDSIIGFGKYHYIYKTKREGDWPIIGFAPRKKNISIYIMSGFSMHKEIMENLGKYKIGKSCLYINKLEDINQEMLKNLIKESINFIESQYEIVK